jgi:crotonobetainyl-CoA:carnitine CoA-transferase CaiB-like acyl-CoA transferase
LPAVKPLDGVFVLDLARILAGPYCTMTLGDLGARVVKVEEPGKGDDTRGWGPPFWNGESAYYLAVNRNKESVTLNLKHPRGREVLWRLIERADVLIENFRPGTLAGLGFDWGTMHACHPRLIYCAISGYGQTGPERDRPGYDLIAQGEGGVMSVTGEAGGPPFKAGVSQADIVAGMWSLVGVLAALHAREKTGLGQRVDASLLEGQLGLLTYHALNYWASGQEPLRLGNHHPNLTPYGAYAASDGWLTIGVGSQSLWARFVEVIEAPELARRPEFARTSDRVAHRDALECELSARFARRTVAEWLERLGTAGIPCGRVRTVPEALAAEQVRSRGAVVDLPHPSIPDLKVINIPFQLSETPGAPASPPPRLGEHTHRVLAELGYDTGALRELAEAGVI